MGSGATAIWACWTYLSSTIQEASGIQWDVRYVAPLPTGSDDQPSSPSSSVASPNPTAPPLTAPPSAVTPQQTPSVQPHQNHPLDAGAKAGVVVGSVLGAAILFLITFSIWRCKKRRARGPLFRAAQDIDAFSVYKFGTPDDVTHVQGAHQEAKTTEGPGPKLELSGLPAERPKSELPV
ncbi:MAG: hypothetical protein Q9163_005108 [Psora crenata]